MDEPWADITSGGPPRKKPAVAWRVPYGIRRVAPVAIIVATALLVGGIFGRGCQSEVKPPIAAPAPPAPAKPWIAHFLKAGQWMYFVRASGPQEMNMPMPYDLRVWGKSGSKIVAMDDKWITIRRKDLSTERIAIADVRYMSIHNDDFPDDLPSVRPTGLLADIKPGQILSWPRVRYPTQSREGRGVGSYDRFPLEIVVYPEGSKAPSYEPSLGFPVSHVHQDFVVIDTGGFFRVIPTEAIGRVRVK